MFMDVTDIEAGVDFVDVLQRAVGSCDVLLAVIGHDVHRPERPPAA